MPLTLPSGFKKPSTLFVTQSARMLVGQKFFPATYQLQNSKAVGIAELRCDWLKYLQKDGIYVKETYTYDVILQSGLQDDVIKYKSP